ncbi:endonuclease domain-containing protein [Streptomyces sp. NPDC055006]
MVKRGQYTGCEFPGCERKHSSKGYCGTHAQQLDDGKPLTPIRGWVSQKVWGPRCRYGECASDNHSRGLCIVHYGRGISQFARDAIFALQGGRCLCGTTDPGPEGWELDHAHDCARGHKSVQYCVECVRGMLCPPCNRRAVAWYEGTWIQQEGNPSIPALEDWIRRRVLFEGPPDSAEVKVRYGPPRR